MCLMCCLRSEWRLWANCQTRPKGRSWSCTAAWTPKYVSCRLHHQLVAFLQSFKCKHSIRFVFIPGHRRLPDQPRDLCWSVWIHAEEGRQEKGEVVDMLFSFVDRLFWSTDVMYACLQTGPVPAPSDTDWAAEGGGGPGSRSPPDQRAPVSGQHPLHAARSGTLRASDHRHAHGPHIYGTTLTSRHCQQYKQVFN